MEQRVALRLEPVHRVLQPLELGMDLIVQRREPRRVLVPVRGPYAGVSLEHGREEHAGAGNVRQQGPHDGGPRPPGRPAEAAGAAVEPGDGVAVLAHAGLGEVVEGRIRGRAPGVDGEQGVVDDQPVDRGPDGPGLDGGEEGVEVLLGVFLGDAGGPDAVGKAVQHDDQGVGLLFGQDGAEHLRSLDEQLAVVDYLPACAADCVDGAVHVGRFRG
ncbi:hypothetical protein PG985_010523 [Apiospora marii]|uniref:Uncharacterized protein n=1 Tax=Apiospora marii TaxID=335849 RepID=A0ABR1T169_9PEZI